MTPEQAITVIIFAVDIVAGLIVGINYDAYLRGVRLDVFKEDSQIKEMQ